MLNPLAQSHFQEALAGFKVARPDDRYTDATLRLALVALQAFGVLRMAHVNDQPQAPWGVLLATTRRPDGDTLDQYLERIIVLDEQELGAKTVEQRGGQIRPGGVIAQAQQASLRHWAAAGLLQDSVWRFDGHTVEYTGQAQIGKTKHGTKAKSVRAVDRYTLYNGINALTDYFPTHVSYDEALRTMIVKANQALPPAYRIRKLCFDKEGWNTETLRWLYDEQGIVPLVWVKNLTGNLKCLRDIPDAAFVDADEGLTIGKTHPRTVKRIADTTVELPHLGKSRVVVLETAAKQRIGIYTAAPTPAQATLADAHCMSTIAVLEALRLQQRVENGFKVDVRELGSDAIPTHKTITATIVEPYDLEQAAKKLRNAQNRLKKYTTQLEETFAQLENEQVLDRHNVNHLRKRAGRLRDKAQREIETLTAELHTVQYDAHGKTTRLKTQQVLDLRKFTLMTLFKTQARVALKLLAGQLGLDGAGPARLRREFLAFGQRVVFDRRCQIATVYAGPFPRARTQQAYERLCSSLYDVPITLLRNGTRYRVRFSW